MAIRPDRNRHVGDHSTGTSKQIGRLTKHAHGHHAAIGDPSKINAARIGNTLGYKLASQHLQICYVVRPPRNWVAAIVPASPDTLRKHSSKTAGRRGLREAVMP